MTLDELVFDFVSNPQVRAALATQGLSIDTDALISLLNNCVVSTPPPLTISVMAADWIPQLITQLASSQEVADELAKPTPEFPTGRKIDYNELAAALKDCIKVR